MASRADSASQGASYGGWVGAYYGYLQGVMSGPDPGFSNSRFLFGPSGVVPRLAGILGVQASAEPPAPTGSGYVPYVPPSNAEWERRRAAVNKNAPPKKPPKPPGPTAADKYPMPKGLPGIFRGAWGALVAYAVLWALPYIYKKASESWSEYFARWQKREEDHRAAQNRRRAGGPGPSKERKPPKRFPGWPGAPAPTVPTVDRPQIVINLPGPAPTAPRADAGLYVPVIYRRPVPIPAALPPTVPRWRVLAGLASPYVGPILSSLLQTGSGTGRVRRRDPLTSNIVEGVPSTSSYYFSGGQTPAAGTKTCECEPKKKRGKKKRRTICYKGSYQESASGTRKRRRDRVPC